MANNTSHLYPFLGMDDVFPCLKSVCDFGQTCPSYKLKNKQNNMKNKKINTEEVSAKYNLVRDKNKGRKFSNEQVVKLLKEAGISGNLATRIVANQTLLQQFKREGMGRGKHIGYIFPYNPIHKTWFENWIYPPHSEKPKIPVDKDFETECANYLKQQGYKLKKCLGFDEESFKKDYPQIWSKYLIYEEV